MNICYYGFLTYGTIMNFLTDQLGFSWFIFVFLNKIKIKEKFAVKRKSLVLGEGSIDQFKRARGSYKKK